jgi:c-di-GMP-binding flagellar brake protein YcgR
MRLTMGGLKDTCDPPAPVEPSPDDSADSRRRHPERRKTPRRQLDTSAEVLLVNVGSRLTCRILDLSLGGCRIRTNDRFPVGIYTRVEVEFHLQGLTFRLGVVQQLYDRRSIGIRFLDLSDRKRRQMLELMTEIQEANTGPGTRDSSAA